MTVYPKIPFFTHISINLKHNTDAFPKPCNKKQCEKLIEEVLASIQFNSNREIPFKLEKMEFIEDLPKYDNYTYEKKTNYGHKTIRSKKKYVKTIILTYELASYIHEDKILAEKLNQFTRALKNILVKFNEFQFKTYDKFDYSLDYINLMYKIHEFELDFFSKFHTNKLDITFKKGEFIE